MNSGLIKDNAAKVGTSKRSNLYSNTQNPGPAHYNTGSRPDSAAFSMGGSRPKHKTKNLAPGPGAYDPDVGAMKENGPQIGFGSGVRGNQGKWKDGTVPGPGNYSMDEWNKGPSIGIGTGQRPKPKGTDVPGPGAYKVPYHIADVPSYILPNRTDEQKFR